MTVSAQYAATHFDDILFAVDNGEEVRIEHPNKPGTQLVIEKASTQQKPVATGRRILGAGVGLVKPPTDQEWDAMKKQLEHDMLDGPIFPPEQS